MQIGPFGFVFRQWQDGGNGFAVGQRQQIDHRAALGLGSAFRQLPDLEPVDLAVGREKQNRRVGRGDEQFGDRILVLGRHARAALAATALGTERVERGAFDIAGMGDGDDHFGAFHQVFVFQTVPGGGNFRKTRGGEFVAHFFQLFAHHGVELGAVGQDREIFLDRGGQFLQLVGNFLAAERGQLLQTQVEDRLHLYGGQFVAVALDVRFHRLDQPDIRSDLGNRPFAPQQGFAGFRRGGRSADDADDLVHIGHRDDQAEQDMGAFARLVQLELGPASDDLFAELDEGFDDVAQIEHFRPAAANGEHIGGEAGLGRGEAPDLVEHDIGRGIALQLDHHPDTGAAGFVANVGDALDPLVLGGFGDLLDETGLADLEGNGGENDRTLVAAAFLDDMARAHHDRPAAVLVGGAGTGLAEDQRSGREIGAGNDLDQLVDGDSGVVDIGKAGVDHLAEIVRRDIGGHADRDTAGAVDQQVGEAGREDIGFLTAAVIIGDEIDRVLVEIVEQEIGDLVEPRFGVTHRRGHVRVHRAEIALAIDQRHPHRPVLGHPGERHVDRAVAMRVIIAHHVADDLGAFAIGASGDHAAFLGSEQYAAMDRLQAVAHIGQGAADDDRHGIVHVAGFHLVDDVDRLDVGRRRWRGLFVHKLAFLMGFFLSILLGEGGSKSQPFGPVLHYYYSAGIRAGFRFRPTRKFSRSVPVAASRAHPAAAVPHGWNQTVSRAEHCPGTAG